MRGEGLGDEGFVVPDLIGADVVSVSGVDESHTGVQRGMDGGDGASLIRPAFDRHRHSPQPNGADLDRADTASLHGDVSLSWNLEPGTWNLVPHAVAAARALSNVPPAHNLRPIEENEAIQRPGF